MDTDAALKELRQHDGVRRHDLGPTLSGSTETPNAGWLADQEARMREVVARISVIVAGGAIIFLLFFVL